MGKRYWRYNKQQREPDLFDHTKDHGELMVAAYKAGGLPLVLMLLGFFSLIVSAYFVLIRLSAAWPISGGAIALMLIGAGVYLHVTKKPELCPKCGSALIKKKGRFGGFLACPRYPECSFTKNIE